MHNKLVGILEVHRCFGCGEKKPCTYAPDPYRADVNDDLRRVWECLGCRSNSAMDV